MTSIDEMRKKFYEEGDPSSDPYGIGVGSSSSAVAASNSTTGRGQGASSSSGARRTSSTAFGASSSSTANARPAPYPKRSSTGRGRTSGDDIAKGKGKESTRMSFVERARNAPDDDDDFPEAGASAMDIDLDGGAAYGNGGRTKAAEGVDAMLAREEREASESDVTKLMRAWQNERHAPDILPSSEALLVRVLDAIRRQSEDASALQSAASMSEEDHYMTVLVQTEVERMKFIVRSYVRTRLHKIEQYAAYITSNASVQARLTAAELRHAQRYASLVVSQFRSTVLDHLPETQQALDDEVVTIPNMITEPNKDKPVFCHAFEALPALMLRDGSTHEIARDAVIMVPYRAVEQLLLRGEVELV